MQLLTKYLTQPFGVALSGGADSIALAHRLRNHNPILYHFNHKFVAEDDAIEEGARVAAKALDLRLEVAVAQERYIKGSKEDFCRKARYKWFQTLGGTLLMAHHLGDAVESYVARCLNGTPEYLPIPVETTFGQTRVARPMILVPKEKILTYLEKHDLRRLVIEDPLNSDLTLRRAWIRMDLLPQIQKRTNLAKVVRKRYLKHLNECTSTNMENKRKFVSA